MPHTPVPPMNRNRAKAMRRIIFSAELRRAMSDAAWEEGQRLSSWNAQAAAFAAALPA